MWRFQEPPTHPFDNTQHTPKPSPPSPPLSRPHMHVHGVVLPRHATDLQQRPHNMVHRLRLHRQALQRVVDEGLRQRPPSLAALGCRGGGFPEAASLIGCTLGHSSVDAFLCRNHPRPKISSPVSILTITTEKCCWLSGRAFCPSSSEKAMRIWSRHGAAGPMAPAPSGAVSQPSTRTISPAAQLCCSSSSAVVIETLQDGPGLPPH